MKKSTTKDSMILDLKNVKKVYKQGEISVHALRGISMNLRAGAFTAIAGPSGSGKSTLLNIIGSLDRATSGSVRVDGQDLGSLSPTQLSRLRLEKFGFIFQSYNLMPVLTAYENAEYVLTLQGVPKPNRNKRVMAVLKQVGLKGMEDRFPRQLSGGQQQRVAVARAIVSQPALVLADEPTANLDSKTAASLLDLMAELNLKLGITFLFSTHDQAVIQRARRLIILQDGKISYDGKPSSKPRESRRKPQTRRTR